MQSKQHNPLYFYLALAGALPFIMSAVLLILGKETVVLLGDVKQIQTSYGLLICSFMAGSQWGQHLGRDDQWKTILPIFTNVLVIAVWFAYLMLGYTAFILVLAIAFAALLFIDYKFAQDKGISKKYLSIRFYVSTIVIVSLLLSLA